MVILSGVEGKDFQGPHMIPNSLTASLGGFLGDGCVSEVSHEVVHREKTNQPSKHLQVGISDAPQS